MLSRTAAQPPLVRSACRGARSALEIGAFFRREFRAKFRFPFFVFDLEIRAKRE